jgi:uncharacterized protein (TIGR02186 family)
MVKTGYRLLVRGYRLLKIPVTCYLLPLTIFITLFFPQSSHSAAIVADVSPRKIDIDPNFKGTKLLVYGARNDAGNIVVVIRGPREKRVLRKKGRVLGIWTNVKNVEIDDFYTYYAVASLKPLSSIQNDSLLKQLEIGEQNIDLSDEQGIKPTSMEKVKEAIIDLMHKKNLYSKNNYEMSFWGETLFRTFFDFPKNIPNGTYNIDIYLFNEGLLRTYQTMPVIVEKVGIEEFINETAHKRPLLYGLICVQLALAIGLIVGALFAKKQLA